MSVRGTSSAHRVNLSESFFLSDLRYGPAKPLRWPVWIKLPAQFVGYGIAWAFFLLTIRVVFLMVSGR